jgi:hypothetical protein
MHNYHGMRGEPAAWVARDSMIDLAPGRRPQ